MLDWIRKPGPGPEDPMRSPASASAVLARLRDTDPVTALDELRGWLGSINDAPDLDERVRSEVLALVQEAGGAHTSTLLRQYLADAAEKPVVREAKWKAMFAYAARQAEVLSASAERLLATESSDASASGVAAAGAARALRACRSLVKVCLIHYADVPPGLWRRAYSVHARAEAAGCANTTVVAHRSQRVSTTATQEFLRLLMLYVIAPDTLASEQIEIADRAMERLGDELTLRPRGVADNPFCFDPEGDRPPQRAAPEPQSATARFFGPGVALDTLERLHRQMNATSGPEASTFGKDIPSHAQIATVEHLLLHWGPHPPRAAPAHAPAKGELMVVHGFASVSRHLTAGGTAASAARGLELAGDDDDAQPDSPEVWTIRDAGGSEVGAEMPLPEANWVRTGMLVTFCVSGRSEWWLGVIRRAHADVAGSAHVDIALLSRKPVSVSLRPQAKGSPGGADWDASAGTFAFVSVKAILLPDASQATGTPNLLLPPEAWMAGRVYEAMLDDGPRDIRLVRLLQRGEDFVRAAFEELPATHPT
jgi:hypothetical protein